MDTLNFSYTHSSVQCPMTQIYSPVPIYCYSQFTYQPKYTATDPEPPLLPSPTPIPSFPTPSEMLSATSGTPAALDPSERAHINKAARKTRKRALLNDIGFEPTDSDTITAHEKKRYWLESLESYVVYLQEQLRLVNCSPIAFERVDTATARPISNRSIRTVLLFKQSAARDLARRVAAEEMRFYALKEMLCQRDEGLFFN